MEVEEKADEEQEVLKEQRRVAECDAVMWAQSLATGTPYGGRPAGDAPIAFRQQGMAGEGMAAVA
eukprot:7605952-Prorocentrum_lima.AAC.1